MEESGSCCHGRLLFDPLAQNVMSEERMAWCYNTWRKVTLDEGVPSSADSFEQQHGQRVHAVVVKEFMADVVKHDVILTNFKKPITGRFLQPCRTKK